MPNDLDAIQARSDAAIYHEGESDGYVLAQRWYQSAKDVPDLVAELRAAREANFDLHQLAIDLDAHDLTAAAAHRLRNILSRWDKELPHA